MWVTKANLIIYCTHFLSSWGNRMWMFALSIFLVRIADDNIQLSASYGLASGLAVFFFGAIVGDWVDNTPRLKAAQLSLALQYLLMLGCTAVVAVYLQFQQPIQASSSSWLSPLLRTGIVCLGVLAELAAQTRVLVVERDWVVEICALDSDHLASMTAMLRRLDLLSMVLAPLAMGQVMQHLGNVRGAVFMGAWVLGSLLVQLVLTWKVYRIVPALKNVKSTRRDHADAELTEDQDEDQQTGESKTPFIDIIQNEDYNNDDISRTTETNADTSTQTSENMDMDTKEKPEENQDTDIPHETKAGSPNSLRNGRGDTDHAHSKTEHAHDTETQEAHETADSKVTCLARASRIGVLHQLVTLYRGGRTYMSYTVALPGLALACLYLTVLSFDNITVAYIVTQGLTESDVGITMSSSAVFGVISTFAYTFIRRRTGVVRTGFLGVFCELSVLTLCVASIWMPGSPFDPLYENSRQGQDADCLAGEMKKNNVMGLVMENTTTATITSMNSSIPFENVWNITVINNTDNSINSLSSNRSPSFQSRKNDTCSDGLTRQGPTSYISVSFFLAGIFLARFGVWMADLAITQLFLEKVVSAERGIVNGVQSSINQLMNLLKFALVVALPDMQIFGFHILITFCSIGTANLLYLLYVRRERVSLCGSSGGGCCSSEDLSKKENSLGEEGCDVCENGGGGGGKSGGDGDEGRVF